MIRFSQSIHLAFLTYTVLLAIRIFGSWVPQLLSYRWMHFVATVTDPYLNLFRRVLPPLGGILDISPLLAFLALQLAENLLLSLL